MSKEPPVNHVVQTASLARAAKEKLRIVMAAAALAPDELGAFLRREGVHEADLQQWREAVAEGATSALENGTTRTLSRGADTRRIKELERELRRKDRALAETAALLVLQVHEIWGDGDDGTGEGDDPRAGPKTRPANALTAAERVKLLKAVNSPEYRSLPPKQVLPRLADEGRYLGSESTLYRVLRAEGQNAHCAHQNRAKPRTVRSVDAHIATAPKQVWSWDIVRHEAP